MDLGNGVMGAGRACWAAWATPHAVDHTLGRATEIGNGEGCERPPATRKARSRLPATGRARGTSGLPSCTGSYARPMWLDHADAVYQPANNARGPAPVCEGTGVAPGLGAFKMADGAPWGHTIEVVFSANASIGGQRSRISRNRRCVDPQPSGDRSEAALAQCPRPIAPDEPLLLHARKG